MTMAVSACALLSSATLQATESPASAPLSEPRDTTVHSATKSLIESFSDLSKTAGKLSETALKLMEAQELLDEKYKEANQPRKKVYRTGKNSQPAGKSKASNHTRRKIYIQAEEPEESYGYDDTEYEEIEYVRRPKVYIGDEESYESVSETGSPSVYISDEGDPEPDLTAAPYQEPEPEESYLTESDDSRNSEELKSIWELPQDENTGGRYIWIPDDKSLAVESVLNGTMRQPAATDSGEPDLDELTYWRGDSIPMAIPTKRLGRYDRKLFNWLIYPKGLWHIGLTANYGEISTDDSEFLSLIKDVDLGGTIYSIKPSVSYFLRNNLCMGLRLAYTKGKMGVDSFNVDIDEDMSFNLHDIKYISENYSAALFLQQYFGLSRRGRFAVYNEVELLFKSGNTHFTRPFDGNMRETRTKTKGMNINYSPGVSIMIMKNAAFNLSFGVFGFHLTNEKQWKNGEECGSRLTSGINFRFNIFNINFGVAIII